MKNEADIRWLAAGAIIGLLAAGYGILRQSSAQTELPDDVVAMVNETTIARDIYERALGRLPDPESPQARAAILQRLVDDELLVQRGVELGMTESDSEVRAAVVNSLVASVTAEADAASPTDEELQQYLADNAERFSYTSKLSVEAWQTDDEPVAQSFVSALRANGSAETSDTIEAVPDLPTGMLPAEMLRDYLGPAITAAAAEMPDGSSAVFARRGRWLVVRVNEKERTAIVDLSAVRNRVILDYRRSLADSMLIDYIENLRQRADVTVAKP
jgi:hypothetical protein